MTVELMRGAQHPTLERLREATGTPLLLLHALRGCRGDWNPSALAWDGPVWALDLSGHGESGWLHGSVYSPEQFAADADIALAHIGAPLCVAGAGSGGYAAQLLAGWVIGPSPTDPLPLCQLPSQRPLGAEYSLFTNKAFVFKSC